jgi:hypothetical protein
MATQYYQPPVTEGPTDGPNYAWSPSTVATTTVSELDSRAARPWSMRTELEGNSNNNSPKSIGAALEDRDKPKGAGGYGQGHHATPSQPQGLGVFVELQG